MRIARIEVFRVELSYSGGTYLLSGGREHRGFDATIVRVTTDGGLEGWSESTRFGATYVAAHARGARAGIAELAPARRQRDLCVAVGLTLSVQDTTGSDLAFAAVVHLGQTVPGRFLRCVLETRAMVNETTVENPIQLLEGEVMAPDTPGLGVAPRRDLLGEPLATYA
jgi:L-alanine-DL-glutamate epimerase-like enolase superfamily enzyme